MTSNVLLTVSISQLSPSLDLHIEMDISTMSFDPNQLQEVAQIKQTNPKLRFLFSAQKKPTSHSCTGFDAWKRRLGSPYNVGQIILHVSNRNGIVQAFRQHITALLLPVNCMDQGYRHLHQSGAYHTWCENWGILSHHRLAYTRSLYQTFLYITILDDLFVQPGMKSVHCLSQTRINHVFGLLTAKLPGRMFHKTVPAHLPSPTKRRYFVMQLLGHVMTRCDWELLLHYQSSDVRGRDFLRMIQ